MQKVAMCCVMFLFVCVYANTDEQKTTKPKKEKVNKTSVTTTTEKEEVSQLFVDAKSDLIVRKEKSKEENTIKPAKTKTQKAMDWTVKHIVVHNGWSLTGYCKLHLDKNFNRRWTKIGLISGELEGTKQERIQSEADKWEEFKRYENHMSQDIVLGVFFAIEF